MSRASPQTAQIPPTISCAAVAVPQAYRADTSICPQISGAAKDPSRKTEFPPAIGFLTQFGVPPAFLEDALLRSRSDQCRPEAALLAAGTVSAEFYYRSLARHLDLPFVEADVELGSGARFPQSSAAGFAPLASEDGERSGWLFAPTGNRLSELLELRSRGALPPGRFSITTPAYLRDLLFRQRGAEIADQAANTLPGWRPDLSARTPATMVQKLLVALFILLGLAALGLGGAYWLALSLFAGTVLAGAIVVRIFAAAASIEPARPPRLAQIDEQDLPVYTVVVALYREAGVAAALVSALDRLD